MRYVSIATGFLDATRIQILSVLYAIIDAVKFTSYAPTNMYGSQHC